MTTYDRAIEYVGAGDVDQLRTATRLHLQTLRTAGLQPSTAVLEIGAGTLHLGAKLVKALDPGCYTAIEPAHWLVAVGLDDADLRRRKLFADKRAVVLHRSDFDPSEALDAAGKPRTYGLVFAHSVLSHGAAADPARLLRAVKPHLQHGAVILTSLRLGPKTTAGPEWTYPDAVEFSMPDILRIAKEEGFTVKHRPEIRERCEAALSRMRHDWLAWKVA